MSGSVPLLLKPLVVLDEGVASGDQVFDAPEATSTNGLLGDELESTLHLIAPGQIGGSLVGLEAWTFCKPEAHLALIANAS